MVELEDYVRSFAMSGFLITDELRRIEQRFQIELGHVASEDLSSAVDYYPQFEAAVRAEAAEMSQHYEVFYCLEQAIRKLIDETFTESDGPDWWNSGRISTETARDVAQLVQRERDNGITPRSDNLIDYTTFGQLSGIITANWTLFEPVIKSRRAVERVMASLNLLRGPIAHCCPIAEDETDRLSLAVKDWFRLIG